MRMRPAISWDPWGSDDEIELTSDINYRIGELLSARFNNAKRNLGI